MNLPVIVISLTSAVERRKSIIRQMEAHNIPFEFLDATDSDSALQHPFAERQEGPRAVRLRSGLVVGTAELACAISHHRALERIVSLGSMGGIVIEDDAILGASFHEFCDQMCAVASAWSDRRLIVHCAENFPGDGAGLVVGERSAVKLACGVSLLRVRRFSAALWGTAGYVSTLAAARSMLLRAPDRADAWRWFLADGTLAEVWLARPAPLRHPALLHDLPSQIAVDREALRRDTLRKSFFRALRLQWQARMSRLLQLLARWTLDPIMRRFG